MLKITKEFISEFSGNSSALSAGKALANKTNFIFLNITEDKTLIFGSCKGSGKNPYNCSVDFKNPNKVVPRCSCPSRQIPCKHVIALLYLYENGDNFSVANPSEDILVKREKLDKKEIKKAQVNDEKPKTLTKAKVNSIIKKLEVQLQGVELASKILDEIVTNGFLSAKSNLSFYETQIKELGNYYISGIQASFSELLMDFTPAKVNFIFVLLKKANEYLNIKIQDLRSFPQIGQNHKELMKNTQIEELIGTAWKLEELKELELYKKDVKLIQLSFDVVTNEAKKEFVDEAIYMDLHDGKIYKTQNFRPFKATKHIKNEDSFFGVYEVNELFIYPNSTNSRVRWSEQNIVELTENDIKIAKSFCRDDFSEVIKESRLLFKDPLVNSAPIFALKANNVLADENSNLAIFDKSNFCLPLKLEHFAYIIRYLGKNELKDATFICKIAIVDGFIAAIPLSVISDKDIIRLAY